jgi:hypothetical protein
MARIHLGIGGDSLPDSLREGANPKAQWMFLQAVQRRIPECRESLREVAPRILAGDGDTLTTWAARWGFAAPWLLRVAQRTSRLIVRSPHLQETWSFWTSFVEPEIPELRITWNPCEQTEAAFRETVEDYIRAVRNLPGVLPAPAKNTDPRRDFEWLALYQVGGRTYGQIAESDESSHGDDSTVRKAVQAAAALALIPLRADGRARPRQSGKK